MSINSKNKYHLPHLTLATNNSPRVELHTASAEFFDLDHPFSIDHYDQETHNAFRGKKICFPRLQRRNPEEFSFESCLVQETCPYLSTTKHKVSAPFTEGLSSLSAREKPTYTIQRTDILSSNLPKTVKLSQERNKTYFSVQISKSKEDKRHTTVTKRKRVEKVDKTMKESREIPPILSFAPDVLDNLKHAKEGKILRPTPRPITPYYPWNKQPRQFDVIPKIVCVGQSLHDPLQQSINLNDTFSCKTIRPTDKKQLTSKIHSDPKILYNAYSGIPQSVFSNIEDSSTMKKGLIGESKGAVTLRTNSDTIFNQTPLNPKQDTTLQTFSFVVKMPRTNGLDAMSKPSSSNPAKSGGISPWCSRFSPSQSCILIEESPIHQTDTRPSCSQDFVTNPMIKNLGEQCLLPEVDVIENNENFRQVTTQTYPKNI